MRRLTPRTRRGKIFAGIFGFILAFALGAVAAFFARAPIEGGTNSGEFSVVWQNSPTAASIASQTDMTCTVSIASGVLLFNVTQGYPGGSCTAAAMATIPTASAEDGKIVGLDLDLPVDWTASLRAADCGKTLVRGTPQVIQFTVTMGANATPGGSSTFALDGLQVSPLSIAPASPTCPVVEGTVQ